MSVSNGKLDQLSTARKPYKEPLLKTWGTVTALTQVGFTNPGTDCLPNGSFVGGSVLNDNTTCPAE
jgi:hypothetical protein